MRDWPYQLTGPRPTLPKVRPFLDNGVENPMLPRHKLRRTPERPKVSGPRRNRKPIVVTSVYDWHAAPESDYWRRK